MEKNREEVERLIKHYLDDLEKDHRTIIKRGVNDHSHDKWGNAIITINSIEWDLDSIEDNIKNLRILFERLKKLR